MDHSHVLYSSLLSINPKGYDYMWPKCMATITRSVCGTPKVELPQRRHLKRPQSHNTQRISGMNLYLKETRHFC